MTPLEKRVKSSFTIITIFFLLLFPNITVAYDNYYLFEQGFRAKRLGNYEQAIASYENYIDGNPYKGDYNFSSPDIGNRQFYLRNLIIAYGNLLKIYTGDEKNEEEVNERLKELKDLYLFARLGSKNAYKLALIMRDNNKQSFSADIYEKIISDQEEEPRDGNDKVVLKSYKKLLNYWQSIGEKDKVKALLSRMTLNYPSKNSDSKDKYKLGYILLKYNDRQKGAISLFEGIIQEYINSNFSTDPDPAIKSIQKLIRLYAKADEQGSLALLEEKIGKMLNVENLSTGKQYKIASTLVNYSNSSVGKNLLKNIVSNSPEAEEAKKSLFILGRNALASKEWNNAIDYYSTYVERYPENTFFTLKAYSKLLDAHFSKGGSSDFLQSETQALSEVVNGVSNYETVLNLSRDIHRKGWDKLSNSTFKIGMEKAQKYLVKEEGTMKELRARWIIEKYAYGLDKLDIVEENARRIFELTKILSSSNMKLAEKDKMQFIKADTHLWMAKVAKDKGNMSESEIQLKIFIEENPMSDDISYAWYQLGEIYQETGLMAKAEKSFAQVTKGIWKEKRNKKLIGITDDQ